MGRGFFVAESLVNGKVLIVGIGGLGCPAALALTSARVSTLGLADGDRVDLSNLHRQLLHASSDLGTQKTAAAERLRRLAPAVIAHAERVTAENVERIVRPYDVVIDATDNPATKFLLNDAAVLLGKPLVYGGVVGLEGQILTILPGRSACLRCLFPEPPAEGEIASCRAAGILGPLAGVVGALQAAEALKVLTGGMGLLADRLLVIDARRMRFREVALRRSPDCPLCGEHPTIRDVSVPRQEIS